MKTKLITIFLLVKVIPLLAITLIAWYQFSVLGSVLKKISTEDSATSLNDSAVETIERISTDTAKDIATFLYSRDDDLRYLASIPPSDEAFRIFSENKSRNFIEKGEWVLSEDGMSWSEVYSPEEAEYRLLTAGLKILQETPYATMTAEQRSRLVALGLSDDQIAYITSLSSNEGNNDVVHGASFHYRLPEPFNYKNVPIYDEIAYIDLDGNEIYKYVTPNSTKINYPLSPEKTDVSVKANTFVKAENYFAEVSNLAPGEIYVSDVIGTYVKSHFIGMYTPKQMAVSAVNAEVTAIKALDGYKDGNIYANLAESLSKFSSTGIRGIKTNADPSDYAAVRDESIAKINEQLLLIRDAADASLRSRVDDLIVKISAIQFNPESEAYAGRENPNGQRFEGIIRFATPVAGENGETVGYITFAVNHDHIMEFVDHITPMDERYIEIPSAFEGNYAFIWDYNCRSIAHPRHHSIYGFDASTGDPEVPWLETSIYEGWIDSGIEKWTDYITASATPDFFEQSRTKKPAPALTAAGLVGLDGRYLNNAPQCTGWMDLTKDGGSGSFYILWSGLYKLNTAAAIPYYTGQYAPSEANGYSKRGFAFVAIGSGLESFERLVDNTEIRLADAISESMASTFTQLFMTAFLIIVIVVFIAIVLASFLNESITVLNNGVSRFRSGERQFRFNAKVKDEFGVLADSFDDMADSIIESVKDPLVITNLDKRIIYVNEYALALSGITFEQSIGKAYSACSIYPADSKYDPIIALAEGKESAIYHYAEKGKYLRAYANYFTDRGGRKIGYMITTTDLTEMYLEHRKIEEQSTLLNSIFASSPDLIWYCDADGRYLAVNPRFAAISGHEADDFKGKTAKDMLPEPAASLISGNDAEALKSSVPIYTEVKLIFFDGHEEIVDTVRTPMYDATRKMVGFIGTARDVTAHISSENALRNTQSELEKAVAEANRASEHKGEFLARMSHEIRTPMNAIIGVSNILKRRLSDSYLTGIGADQMPGIDGDINQIIASSQHLLGLLNDILDITKIEAGKIELTDEETELKKLADTVVSIIQPRCDEKNISFVTSFELEENKTFICDSLRLRQVLINLLGNSVKFTPELGRIDFEIKKITQKGNVVSLKFIVRDNGIGISDEAMARIFSPFEQAGKTISRQYGGTGLGLAISHSIVKLFGGDIEVHSELGKGSEFSFTIPLTEVLLRDNGVNDEEDATDRFIGKHALLVDDVAINRMIVMSILEETGIEVEEADDGIAAVQKFRESPTGFYDIIFMDIQMPNMDGYESTKTIRALDRPDAASVPIIALTANAFKEDIDKAVENDMNAHIAKPVEMEKINQMLFRFIKLDD
ncbi:hypothetical protein FACS1894219_05040 [Clostridia bacterium]|nr:hypothetical protein FACS1894219_05040 [Clostridia bacterium]